MAIFRIQEHVPDVYARKSRDFQLLCNAWDALQSCVKYDIDSIADITDTRRCNERLLPLLQTKLGFFTRKELTANELRKSLQSFKYLVKDKGSRTGIRDAIEVYLSVLGASNKSKINITNAYVNADGITVEGMPCNTYVVEVAIEGKKMDTTLLTELLKYVLPPGYLLEYSFYTSAEQATKVDTDDKIQIVFVDTWDHNGIVLDDYKINKQILPPIKEIVNSEGKVVEGYAEKYLDIFLYQIETYSYNSHGTDYSFSNENYYIKKEDKFVPVNDDPHMLEVKHYIQGTKDFYLEKEVSIVKGTVSDLTPSFKEGTFYKKLNENEYQLFENEEEYTDYCNQRLEKGNCTIYTKDTVQIYIPLKTIFNSISAVGTSRSVENNPDLIEKIKQSQESEYPTENNFIELPKRSSKIKVIKEKK